MCMHLYPFSLDIFFLAIQLKAFETPSLRAALGTAKGKLLKSQQSLDTMRTKCTSLAEQILAKEQFFTANELVLKQTQCELDRGESNQIENDKLMLETSKLNHFSIFFFVHFISSIAFDGY